MTERKAKHPDKLLRTPAPPMLGTAEGYVSRSEGVRSNGIRDIARRALSDPDDVAPEEIRKLAAAILAHRRSGH